MRKAWRQRWSMMVGSWYTRYMKASAAVLAGSVVLEAPKSSDEPNWSWKSGAKACARSAPCSEAAGHTRSATEDSGTRTHTGQRMCRGDSRPRGSHEQEKTSSQLDTLHCRHHQHLVFMPAMRLALLTWVEAAHVVVQPTVAQVR